MVYLGKIRLVFNIIIIILVFSVVAFSLFKILHNEKKQQPMQKNKHYSMLSIHWNKNNYIVPISNITLSENEHFTASEYYYVTQFIDINHHQEKCYMGFLKLQSIKKDRYVFTSKKALDKSKLFKFAQFYSHKLMIKPLTKNEYLKDNPIINCENWILINNLKNKNLITKKQENKIQTLKIKLNTCFKIPAKKFIVIESLNSDSLYLEHDKIYDKVNLCSKNYGNSIINFYPSDGSHHFLINSLTTESNKKEKVFKNHEPTNKKDNDSLLTKKILPGWQ